MYMEIIMQTIRIIDYENNKVVNRDIPDAFSDYVRQLIAYNEKDQDDEIYVFENVCFYICDSSNNRLWES